MKFVYPASICRFSNDEYVVSFRDVPWCHTSGADLTEALAEAEDALEEAIAAYINQGEPIPRPSELLDGEFLVSVPVDTAAKAALAMAIHDSGMTRLALAQRLGVHDKMVGRMLDTRCVSSVNEINGALRVLGRRAVLEVQEVSLEPQPGSVTEPSQVS